MQTRREHIEELLLGGMGMLLGCGSQGKTEQREPLPQPEPTPEPAPIDPPDLFVQGTTIKVYGQNTTNTFSPEEFPLEGITVRIRDRTFTTDPTGTIIIPQLIKGTHTPQVLTTLPLREATIPAAIITRDHQLIHIPHYLTTGPIALFGDSNYTRNSGAPEENYDSPLDEFLDGRDHIPGISIPELFGTHITVRNYSGSNLASTDGEEVVREALRRDGTPLIALLGYGIIDSHQGRSPEDYREVMERIAEQLAHAGSIPFILGLAHEENRTYAALAAAYNHQLREIATRHNYPLVSMNDIRARERPELFYPENEEREGRGRDHLNRKGHRVLAERIRDEVIRYTTTA